METEADTGLAATHKAAGAVADDGAADQPYSPGYTRYAMTLLMLLLVVNFLDRQIINILAEPIKIDLGLSDWQLGLMSGLAFAFFYTFMGLPIARLAERADRTRIIGISVAVWSGFTALCGTATSFVQLVLYRIGVGIGEAGGTPPAHALIVDYVPRAKRASALAFYSMGNPIGSLVGLILGGLVADAYGWRAAFLIAGVPGLFFAALTLTTLREPRHQLARHSARQASESASFKQALSYLIRRRTFLLIAGAGAIKAFIGYGHAPFTASFLFRNHPEEIAELASTVGVSLGFNLQSVGFVGLALGIVTGIGGVAGTLIGGSVADRFAVRNLKAYMATPAIASLLVVPVFIAAVSVPSAALALALLGLNSFLSALWYGPVFGAAQSVVTPDMRATTAAIFFLIINLIGLGLGPVFVGLLSDWLNLSAGYGAAEGIRWALIITACMGIFAGAGFWLARCTIVEDTVS